MPPTDLSLQIQLHPFPDGDAVASLCRRLGHHVARGFGHDHLGRVEGRCPQHADGVVMGQHHMGNRLVGHAADAVDHLLRQARGRLRLDHHHAVVDHLPSCHFQLNCTHFSKHDPDPTQ